MIRSIQTVRVFVTFFGAYFMGMMALKLHSETDLLPWVPIAFFIGGVTPWLVLLALSLKETST